jgi:hypothetical protein
MKDSIEKSLASLPENSDVSGSVRFKRKGTTENERISCSNNASIIPGLQFDVIIIQFGTREELLQIINEKGKKAHYQFDAVLFNNPRKG